MSRDPDRRLRILRRLAVYNLGADEASRLCAVSSETIGMTGAGIMLMSGDVPRGSLCSSNPTSETIERLQFELGEGPCVDAYEQGRPIMEPDLADPHEPRWVAFAPPAVRAGARAVFGFPMSIGAVRLGALNLYRDRPGPMTDGQHADALVLSEVAAHAVLLMQANAPPGTLAIELEPGSGFLAVVHQAAGMVAAQLDVTVGHAMIRLRAHAFGNDRPLVEVARSVVRREFRFDAASGEDDTGR